MSLHMFWKYLLSWTTRALLENVPVLQVQVVTAIISSQVHQKYFVLTIYFLQNPLQERF